MGAPLEIAEHDVEAEFRRDPDHQRQAPHIGEVELEPEEMHEADGPQEPQHQRQQGQGGFFQPADHEERQAAHEDERVDGALQVPALHQPGRLVGDHGRAGHRRVHRA